MTGYSTDRKSALAVKSAKPDASTVVMTSESRSSAPVPRVSVKSRAAKVLVLAWGNHAPGTLNATYIARHPASMNANSASAERAVLGAGAEGPPEDACGVFPP